jgi:hypothetical protein
MSGSLISGSDTSSFDTITDGDKQYAGKSSRRIWLNSYQSRWDGLIPQLDVDSSDHYVCTGIDGAPSFTAIELEHRSSGRPTIYWDDANKKLHCFSAHNTTSRFWTLDYDDVTDAYSYAVGDSVAGTGGITVTGMDRSTNSMTMAMTKTPNGDIWVFGIDGYVLKMQHSTDDGATWETSATTLETTAGNGSVDCTYFTNGGTTYVCVFASEDDLVGGAAQYFFYIDQNHTTPTTATNWTDESSILPSVDATAVADNHVCMCADSSSNIYAAFKQGGASDQDDLKLIKRTAAGTWSGTFEAWNDTAGRTRPVIAVKKKDSSSDEELIIIAAVTGDGATVKYKTTDLDTISFSAETTIFEDTEGSDAFNDPVVYQGDFVADSDSGFLVIAHNVTDEKIWANTIVISPAAGGSLTANTAWRITNQKTQDSAWRVQAQAAADSAWRVFGQAVQPSSWRLFSNIGQASGWKIKGQLSRNSAWKTFNQAGQDSAWSIFNRQAADSEWKVFGSAEADTDWRILTSALMQDTAWRILTSNQASQPIAWKILNTLQQASACRLFAQAVQDSGWAVLNQLSQDSGWALLNTVQQQALWKILATEQADSAYKVLNSASVDSSWRVLAQQLQASGWRIFSTAGLDSAWIVDGVSVIPITNIEFTASQREIIISATERTIIFTG